MLDFIKSRRSTRKFKENKVPDDILAKIIEAGRYAPSGGNSQSTHFIIVTNKDILDELARLAMQEFAKMSYDETTYKSIVNSINASKNGNYVFHYNAPALIITANKKDYGNNIADCACALENMMLMANSLDLGSVWINQLRWLGENPIILNKMFNLGMDNDERVYGALAVGYPDTDDGLPIREPLKRTGNIVTYID